MCGYIARDQDAGRKVLPFPPRIHLKLRVTMMFPCSALPPPLYPAFLRPPAALPAPLNRALPSGFLVEDLLRLSQPVGYIHRTFCPTSLGDADSFGPEPGSSSRVSGPSSERPQSSGQQNRSGAGSSIPSCPDSGFLKFGVNAILAPCARNGESRWRHVRLEMDLKIKNPNSEV